jgi:23S rRNA A2030 N6-methylase RlmJ
MFTNVVIAQILSPVLGQNLLRKECDEHRLLDINVEEVQWLNNETADFRQANVYDSMEFILPYTDGGKHPIIFLDPDYSNESDYGNVKKLVTDILDQHPYATVIVWIPLLQNHKFRWSFPSGMRDIAKKYCKSARYYCSMNVSAKDFQGSAVLLCNPTRDFDEIMSDECIHFLANVMNYGKDEFLVEQTNKKKNSASA